LLEIRRKNIASGGSANLSAVDLTFLAFVLTLKEKILPFQTAGTSSVYISSIWSLVMTPAFPPCLNRSDWRTLYRAAILETNKNVLPKRVSEAEEAVRARGREIFYADSTLEEKEALEDALYALRAFRRRLLYVRCAPRLTLATACA
jgi:hypothetical protein